MMIKTNRDDFEEEEMKKSQTVPTMCKQCRWHDVLGCMYYGELRENFNPGIKLSGSFFRLAETGHALNIHFSSSAPDSAKLVSWRFYG